MSCQCTQCRKWAGAVIMHFISVPKEDVQWQARETLKDFEASPGIGRGFCEKCVSSIYWWRKSSEKGVIGITTASLDHDHFQDGRGKELFTPIDGRYWCCKEIEGVTTPDAAYRGGPGLLKLV